ncbi:MAG: Transcriptional regulator of heat shock protein [Candidatus Magasanikbacteria bacterium GW2011_GWC2_41_17]|uniref:Transcriptional regulator of heat shock protein n=1 Tax=Candidatus Magasanikbacteria bacterium GW2011_GWC2_41_17 TaxID=1619048 RepID=A0A0G0XKZ8_9BACT|nr:MAG: Transcriptional regulator of heat shock protein [Candidatus Magasanikbacteria bacterium GW2011_GWC2_41_17]HBX16084.1 hypothetical protein [Candidatus Magasanikbacteria bacterium]
MDKRREQLFKQIVKIYLTTAEPVGSLFLADKLGDVSSATIRNEMMALEEDGYIYQPHISAGRVPTAKGYKFFVDNFVDADRRDEKTDKKIAAAVEKFKGDEQVKAAARASAEISQEAVIVAFSPNQLYFTGLSNLFAKPEFREQVIVTSVSQILDHCEEMLPRVLELIGNGKKVLIGSDNPFGKMCSFIAAPIRDNGLFGILGPMRMDYEKNLELVNFVKTL